MKKKDRQPSLVHKTIAKIRFSEVDAMNIAWHGSYVKYLEDGREDFGNHFGIGYQDIYYSGYKAPIVDMRLEYKASVTFGETITIETRYINCDAAKIEFDYIIYNESGTVVATAYTIQVFLDEENILVLNCPEFYLKWKEKWKIK